MSNSQGPGNEPQSPYDGGPVYGQGQYGPPGGQPPPPPPQGGYGYQGGGAPPPPPPPPPAKNPLAALFDFSFNHFITPVIIKVVYVVATILLGLLWLIWLIAGFSQSVLLGLGVLIVGSVAVIIWLAFLRMTLEFYLSIVRMSEEVHHRIGDPTR